MKKNGLWEFILSVFDVPEAQDYEEWEQALRKWERSLRKQEQKLEARKAELERREQIAADAAARSSLDGYVLDLRQDFMVVRAGLSTAQEHLVNLMQQIQNVQNTGIRELCWLHRAAAADAEDGARRFAVSLEEILRESFGAEPIEPAPGDSYDSSICERGSGTGRRIVSCKHRGWRWKGGVFRAIVETADTE